MEKKEKKEKKTITEDIIEEMGKEVKEVKEEKKPEVKKGKELEVLKTIEYDKYGEIIKLTPKAHTFRNYIIQGDIIEVTDEEAKELIKLGICKEVK